VHVLAQSIRPSELTDPELTLEEIAWRLFHDEHEVRIDAGDVMAKGCRCDPDHIRDVIARFPASERSEMADDAGDIVVNCEFCSRKFPISLASLSN
jgi:molecular chaperone Hsp33